MRILSWKESENLKKIKQRILEISFKEKLSHLGSCLTAVSLIYRIYREKKKEDIFILSQGHAGLALYCVLEHFYKLDAYNLWKKHGTHPNLDIENHIHCSTGSLGHGFPIAVGMALADRERKVYCLISDGECAEGSIWEALRIAEELKLENLKVWVNMNGYSAYGTIDKERLKLRLSDYKVKMRIWYTNVEQIPCLKGIDAHYKVMSIGEYQWALLNIK